MPSRDDLCRMHALYIERDMIYNDIDIFHITSVSRYFIDQMKVIKGWIPLEWSQTKCDLHTHEAFYGV